VPGLRRIVIPLGDNPLGTVNAYLVEAGDGPVLIDTGWRTPEARAALDDACAAIGRRVADLRQIVLTHAHPDHAGLASTLRECSGAPILLHPADRPFADPARRQGRISSALSGEWFRRHGLPPRDREAAGGARGTITERNPPFVPDADLADGQALALGPFTFRVIWCPGHAPGQVSLYDERAGLLIAGDHVLPAISPNVGIYSAEDRDPLGDYLASLVRVRDLPVGLVLPGHGAPFRDLARRVDEIAAHHEARFREILAQFAGQPLTAFDLCACLTWAGGRVPFAGLHPFQQTLALAETIAHLEVLRARGQVARTDDGDLIRYARAAGM
jgi:glyoxylase-like metal-dependent hydrolase (beta-lactamase superfamily II)